MNRILFAIFAVWLVALLVVGYASLSLPVYGGMNCNTRHQLPYYRLDSFWYTTLSRHAYTFSEVKNSSIAFFPFYPIVIRATHQALGFHEDRVSLGLNILFSFLIVWFLAKLARLDYSEKKTVVIVAVFLSFPPTYFFLSGYPDALFVLLAVLSLYFGRREKWNSAGIAAGLLAITKPYGIFMWLALVVEYLSIHDWNFKIFLKKFDWIPLLLPVISFGGFVIFNFIAFHNPFAFLTAQKTWGRSLANPMSALFEEAHHFLASGTVFSGSNFPYLVYVASFLFSLVACALSWKRVRKSYLIFSGLLLLSALLTGTLTSFGRYVLLGFPLLFGPALFLVERRYLLVVYLFASFFALLALASLFVRCYPVE